MIKQHHAVPELTPAHFLSEVDEFRDTLADPKLSADQKKCAYSTIVHHAAALDPHDIGFESAGVALKEALCLWLDSKRPGAH